MDGIFHLGYSPESARFRAPAATLEKNSLPLETGARCGFHRGLAAESRSSLLSFSVSIRVKFCWVGALFCTFGVISE